MLSKAVINLAHISRTHVTEEWKLEEVAGSSEGLVERIHHMGEMVARFR